MASSSSSSAAVVIDLCSSGGVTTDDDDDDVPPSPAPVPGGGGGGAAAWSHRSAIAAAIVALNDRGGSSSAAIEKRVRADMPVTKQWQKGRFLNALKRAVADRDLVQVRGKYKLSADHKRRAAAAAASRAAAGSSKKHALRDSTKHSAAKKQKVVGTKEDDAGRTKAPPMAATKKPPKNKSSPSSRAGEDDFNHDDDYMKLLRDGFPECGSVSPCENYYVTENNESYNSIAAKIGLEDWKALNRIEFNTRFYGTIAAKAEFKRGTIVKIPTKMCSKWKLSKLVDNHVEEVTALATCSKCLKKEQPGDADEILMCDGCDLEIHVSCAGLAGVPATDWLCESCLAVMEARRKSAAAAKDLPTDKEGRRSLEARLPPLPEPDATTLALAEGAWDRFREDVGSRREAALEQLEENQRVLAEASRKRIADLAGRVRTQKEMVARQKRNLDDAKRRSFHRHGLNGWLITELGESHINFVRDDGTEGTVHRNQRWNSTYTVKTAIKCSEWGKYFKKQQLCVLELRPEVTAHKNAKALLDSLIKDFDQAKRDDKRRPPSDEEDRNALLLEYAKLLSEPRLDCETQKKYLSRVSCDPIFLGVVQVEDEDVRVLNILREPTELVLTIPVQSNLTAIDVKPIESGEEYYLFGTAKLFSPERNDFTPMDFSPTSTRTAQRDLMAMLQRDPRNKALLVTRPEIPASVSLRGTRDETLGEIVKCFDLSELVRDCHYPIENQPAADTPKRLADNGLVLRNYQKTSLQWLLDKESNPTGMGSSGELWSRMRGLGSKVQEFFYCELTGSIVINMFDYHSDVDQKDASKLCGDTFPSAAIIGSEMGLGKTVIALSLVVASPPSLQNRVLPREHIAKIDHPAYVPPPSVAKCTSSTSKASFLSNATLVIAPMTLCPQWQTEIQRFAPWMSFITLHNDETEFAAEIASKDMVVVSTSIMTQPSAKAVALHKKLRQIHFHRIFLDESHIQNGVRRGTEGLREKGGDRASFSLARLSSTHRYCVTGTPVGHSLAELYGQLRFLRVPQFCRPRFWLYNIDQPYSEHNCYALNVLRSILSRLIIRHSKEQTLDNGNALVTLPPRTVETLLLPFGSEAERKIYEYLEMRNIQRFMALRSDSPTTVLGQYIDLTGMLYSARLACGHSSLVDLDSLHRFNEKLEVERLDKLGVDREAEKEKIKKKKSATRAEVFNEAIAKARPSAQSRMRAAVLQFQEGEVELMECPVCLEATGERDIALTPCAHKFCAECILSCLQSLSHSREPSGKCPECRETITKGEITFLGDAKDAGKSASRPTHDHQKTKANEAKESNVDINGFHLSSKDTFTTASGAGDRRIFYEPLDDSEKRQQRVFCHTLPPEFLTAWNAGFVAIGTKVARLLEEINLMIERDPTAKAVVFSQFLGTLDVAGQEMTARGITCVRVDGMMKQHLRADAIQSFTTDPSTRVLLLSMRAGAAGLNLMAANHCFLMDPAMNSAVEEQAIDRIHRIGQTRPVFVKRLIIKDSIEERILKNRRSLAADRPATSTQLDGAGLLEDEEEVNMNQSKRSRHADENDMGEKTFQRLRQLEALFGCSATVKVSNAQGRCGLVLGRKINRNQ